MMLGGERKKRKACCGDECYEYWSRKLKSVFSCQRRCRCFRSCKLVGIGTRTALICPLGKREPLCSG